APLTAVAGGGGESRRHTCLARASGARQENAAPAIEPFAVEHGVETLDAGRDALVRRGVFELHGSDRPDGNAILFDEKRIFVRAVRAAAILDHADAARCHLVDHAMIERDDAIGDVFFEAEASQRFLAALADYDYCDAFFLEPAKNPAELGADDGLIGQGAEKNFNRVEHYALSLDRINRVTEPDEKAFEIVLARFLELGAIREDVIEQQFLFGDKCRQIEAERSHVGG